MGDMLQARRGRREAPGDRVLNEPAVEHQTEIATVGRHHQLDGEGARALHRRLLSWYYYERDRQAANRLEMAMDHDFYDGDQWDPEDAAVLASRKQAPLVYNEVAPMADWLIGTERRNRVDWKILPRAEDDVALADIKTKTLKYVSDLNHVPFNRSRAFADAIKGGIGYIDDGVRDDPTQDILYSRYEDWRNVLMDSSGLDPMGEDARYLFRWRWVDEDIAVMMFPDREHVIRRAVEDWAFHFDPMDDELSWQAGPDAAEQARRIGSFAPMASGTASTVDAQRRRVKLIECQYREPTRIKIVADGPMRGAVFDERDKALVQAVSTHGSTIIDKITMRVHVCVFTEGAMLGMGQSIYRHNKFSLTPVVCYRRGRDRQWYGVIRRVRGIQQDLNKRASKALWLLNTNQLIGDEDAFEDWETAREEAQSPDGALPHRRGAKVEIRRDTDAATGQLQIMAMAAQAIQKASGVTDENLGRKTNAVSGEAIKARQLQGSVVTTEPFDNLRLSVQAQGEKQLSLIEQFYTEQKVVRLTGAQGGIEWVKINEPEVQADGSVRWLNDVTASMADFVVSEADYAGTLRQVMFDAMTQLSQRLPPEVALKFLRMAFQFSDLPNKNEIVEELRRLTGEPDPTKPPSPEDEQRMAEQAQMQAEAMQVQRASAMAALEHQQAQAREVNARAEKVLAEIDQLRSGVGQDGQAEAQAQIEQAVAAVREEAATEIEQLSAKLAKVTSDSAAEIAKIRTDADSAAEVARIQGDSAVRVAEVQKASDEALQKLTQRIEDLSRMLDEGQGA